MESPPLRQSPFQQRPTEPMPIYEYNCQACGQQSAHFFRTFAAAEADEASLRCSACAGPLQRRLSKPTLLHSEQMRLSALGDAQSLNALEAEEPRAMAQLLRQVGGALGEPLDGEMGEIVGRLAAGESPAAVGATLPDPAPTP